MQNAKAQHEAAKWLVELRTTEDLDAVWPAFYAWYELSENRSAYLELEKAWRIGEHALAPSALRRSPATARFVEEVRATSRRRQTLYRIGVRTGISILCVSVACLLTAFLLFRPASHASRTRYETAYGEIASKVLPDGSQIHLNTNSRIWVRLTPELREVSLEEGEALFAVASDPSRPFYVIVDRSSLRAIGTEFSVRREPEGSVRAFVTKGTIELTNHAGPDSSGQASQAQLLRASAGDIINITPIRTEVITVGASAIQQRLAWLRGKIDVDGTLADAVAEFNRYNQRRLEITDPVISQKHIQGLFKATDPEAFAREVQHQLGVPYTYSGSPASNFSVIRIGALN